MPRDTRIGPAPPEKKNLKTFVDSLKKQMGFADPSEQKIDPYAEIAARERQGPPKSWYEFMSQMPLPVNLMNPVEDSTPAQAGVNLAMSALKNTEVIKNSLRKGVTLHIPGVGAVQVHPTPEKFLNILWSQVEKPGTGQGNVLYNTALDYAKQNGYKGLMSDPLSRNNMSDRMWDSFNTSGLRDQLIKESRLSPTGSQKWDVLFHPDVKKDLF